MDAQLVFRALAACLLVAAGWGAAAAQAQRPASRRLPVGVSVNAQSDLTGLGDLGFSWARMRVVIGSDQPGPVNTRIAAAHSLGLRVLLQVLGDVTRVQAPDYQQDLAAAMAALAAAGADAIEVWHFANIDSFYGGGGHGAVSAENYAGLLRQAYGAIKAANPRTLVISGALASTGYYGSVCGGAGCNNDTFLADLADTDAAKHMDCLGVAVFSATNPPTSRRGGPTDDHHSYYYLGTLDVSYASFRRAKSLCITGVGYVTRDGVSESLPPGFAWAHANTLQDQGRWLAGAIALAQRDKRVQLLIVQNWDGRGQIDNGPLSPRSDLLEGAYCSILRPDGSCPACVPIANAIARR